MSFGVSSAQDGTPMRDYRTQIASSVGQRDGLALELIDARGERVAEVFRDDKRDGALTFNSFGEISVPLDVFVDFIHSAERDFLEG